MALESIRGYSQISGVECLGCCALKLHMPWFDEECYKFFGSK
jgi:hypothetical protein